ncbi:MAG: proton-conducting transporter membrane subunit [Kineosporiaceae bacterium]
MSVVDVGLRLQLALALAGMVSGLAAPAARRSRLTGAVSAATAAAGLVTGISAMAGVTGSLTLPSSLPLGALTFAPDRLGGLFMAVAGGVGVLAAVFGIGYAHGAAASATAWTAFAAFLPAVQLVPAAADVLSFLLVWEAMAIASTVLLLADHGHRPEVVSAVRWYAVMTQLGFLGLLGGFAVLATARGGTSFALIAGADAGSTAGRVALVLLTAGFAAKAGLVPVHVWLPRAHPEAPSHVSAVMSAAMVATGIYGLVMIAVRWLPAAPQWWGIVLVALGIASAVHGILQASVATDLKRLLGYSTTENSGLMTIALGASVLLRAEGERGVADVALVACLLLVVSHAAFKTTLFLGAGSVVHATGERDLDRLGGLWRSMPWTGSAMALAGLGAAALPVTAGFVSEWVLLQAIIHGGPRLGQPGVDPSRVVAVMLPLALAAVALTAGLALLTFVKAIGVAFLARPRSEAARDAREGTPSMIVAMVGGAVVLVGLGFLAGPLAIAVAASVGAQGIEATSTAGILLTGVGAGIEPVRLSGAVVVITGAVAGLAWVLERRQARRRTALQWGCGGVRLSPRMQYTATSYAEPLVRVFAEELRPSRDVAITHTDQSRFVVARVEFRQQLGDPVEPLLYRPVQRGLNRLAEWARGIQNGSIHRYLSYSFVALVAVLAAVAR